MFFSVLPSLTFCSVSSMTEKNIYEQERILSLYFVTYCMSLCSFSRETVLLTEEEQSLLNSFLVTDNNYVEYHGMVVDFHFTMWPINKRRLREDRCSKLSFFGYQMSTKPLHHSASSTWLEEKMWNKYLWVEMKMGSSLCDYHDQQRRLKLEKEQLNFSQQK